LADEDKVDLFDTSFFTMSKAEIESLDPQQRLLLEVVFECMESAGQQDWRGQNTGVFVGTWGDVSFDIIPLPCSYPLNETGLARLESKRYPASRRFQHYWYR
jgi:hypothetical protein